MRVPGLLFFLLIVLILPAVADDVDRWVQDLKNANHVQEKDNLLYSEEFSDPKSGWVNYLIEDGGYSYQGGKYYITINSLNRNFYANARKNFSDFVMEVEATKKGGPDHNLHGVLLRYVDKDDYYNFGISSDGNFTFNKMYNGHWITLIPWTKSSAIRAGSSKNVIKAVAQGDTFAFYVNNQKVAEAHDSTFASGDVGLHAGSYNEGDVQIAFDNLKIWEAIDRGDVFEDGEKPPQKEQPISPANITRHDELSSVVSPSDEPQTVSYHNEVMVTIPGGLLKESQALTVARVEGLPGEDNPALLAGKRYDISLGEVKSFDKEITIKMALDVSRLNDSLSPPDQIIVTSWNETKGIWERLPFEVENSTIIAHTKHLSIWTIWYVANGYEYGYLLKTSPSGDCKIRIWYLPQDIEEEMTVMISNYFDKAWETYESEGFRMPAGTFDVFLFIEEEVPCYKPQDIDYTIYFYIRQESLNFIYCDIAHELFHAVQNTYMNFVSMLAGREWWMDTTASYAEAKVAWPNDDVAWKYVIRETTPAYLKTPLDQNSDPHRYTTAIFIDYLVREKGANFKKMWDYTSNPSWGDIADALDPLDKYLKETSGITEGLAQDYLDFAEYYLFDLNSPMPAEPDSLDPTRQQFAGTDPRWQPLRIPLDALDKTTEIKRSDPTALWDVTLEPYTAKLWEITVFEDSPASINIVFESASRSGIGGLFSSGYESVMIYLLKGLRRSTAAEAFVTTLNSQDKKSTSVELQPGDGLYVLAVDKASTGLNLKLRASMPFMEIQRPFSKDENGVAGEFYSFSTVKSGIPEDAGFEWSFGDNTTALGENSLHKFESAGSYDVRVVAKWTGGRAENETEIQIGEPPSLEIQLPFSEDKKGSPGTEYSFSLIKKGIPEDAEYEWSFGDGNTARGEIVTHKFASEGDYAVKVVATWKDGSAEAEIEIQIQSQAQKWKFSIPLPGDKYCLGSEVPFRLAPEYAVPGDAKITWSFGDGQTRAGGDASNAWGLWADHKYAASGAYTVEVDGRWSGGSAHAEIQIEIIPCQKDGN